MNETKLVDGTPREIREYIAAIDYGFLKGENNSKARSRYDTALTALVTAGYTPSNSDAYRESAMNKVMCMECGNTYKRTLNWSNEDSALAPNARTMHCSKCDGDDTIVVDGPRAYPQKKAVSV